MRVGIKTFHRTTNYGAILQTFALQKYINDLGIECEVIDYNSEAIVKKEEPMRLTNINSIKALIKYISGVVPQRKKHKKFNQFLKNNIKISKIRFEKNTLKNASIEYDLVIVGSDQVWNLDLTEQDYSYFLDYIKDNSKKASYAASFGYENIPDKYQEKSKKLLEQFNYLSVREKQGKAIINNLTGQDASIVLDPTFLISKDIWNSMANNKVKQPKNYILVYFIHNGPSTFDFIKKLSREYNCDIVYINKTFRLKKGMKNIRSASPNEFLALLQGAKYVVTGSFHGVALSIIMNKQFFYERAQRKNNYNSRIDSIISLLGLEGQSITNNDKIYSTIDYDRVNGKLDKLKNDSVEYLNRILKSGDN